MTRSPGRKRLPRRPRSQSRSHSQSQSRSLAKNTSALLALVAALPLSAVLAACSSSESTSESPAARYRQDPAALKRGKSLFVGTCGAYCHGLQPGNRDAPYLFDCEWKHGGSDEEIFGTIRGGVPNTRMQAFADRMPEGDEDLWKIVAFLKANARC